MKKFFLVLLLMSNIVSADVFTMDNLIKYGLPCVGSMLVANIMVEKNPNQIGSVGCVVGATTVYAIDRSYKGSEEVYYEIAKSHKDMLIQVKAYQEEEKRKMEEFRDVIRRVIAEKIAEERLNIEQAMLKTIDKKDFQSNLDKRLDKAITSAINSASEEIKNYMNLNREAFIRPLVDEASKRLLKQRVMGASDRYLEEEVPEYNGKLNER